MKNRLPKDEGSYKATVRAVVEIKVEGTWEDKTSIRDVRAQAIREAEDRVHRAVPRLKWSGAQRVRIDAIEEED